MSSCACAEWNLSLNRCVFDAVVCVCAQPEPLPAVQGLSEADPRRNESFWPRNGYRTRQHRLQLRHARRLGHISPPRQFTLAFRDICYVAW